MASTSRPRHPHAGKTSKISGATSKFTRHVAATLTLACLASGLGGCDSGGKTIGDYLNLRNSFLNPAEVGRFDKDNPWGSPRAGVKAPTWPILDQLDVVDAPANEWSAATDPMPGDLAADNKEFTIGAGDLLRISIYDLATPGQEYLKEATVSETGTVDVLYLGSVKIAGLTASQANDKIAQVAIEKHAILPAGNGNPGPQVSTTVLQSRGRIFSILGLGTVSRPGTYNIIGSNFRVLDALALAGDLQMQPGLDYLYVIRQTQNETPAAVAPPENTGTPGATTPPAGGNPLDAIDNIEKTTTAPAGGSTTAPAATTPEAPPVATPPAATTPAGTAPAGTSPAPMTPGAAGPSYLRPLPLAVVMNKSAPGGGNSLAQADLDAALTATGGSTHSMPVATPPNVSRPDENLLDRAMEPPAGSKSGQQVFIDGKWVELPAKPNPAGAPPAGVPGSVNNSGAPVANPGNPNGGNPAVNPGPATGGPGMPLGPANEAYAAAERVGGQRVIRIPIAALRSGDARYNIVIRPGDVINVPPVETGEFYMMGHVARPGVFALTGRKITLKMAVAAAGSLDALAIPRRCDLIRRIGTNQEAIVQVNLQAIFDGTQPDIFLKPNDLINVGTDAISPFLAVTRNAYRLSYGLGFVYDRNFYIQPGTTGQ